MAFLSVRLGILEVFEDDLLILELSSFKVENLSSPLSKSSSGLV
jgi:UDP-N-acetylmuramoylalanine-D-glutamate ligase